MAQVTCPSCGSQVEVPAQKSKTPWLVGCLVAAATIPVLVAVIGLLAAIAIPSFVKARNTAQMNACVNNMRIMDGGKESWAMANRIEAGKQPDIDGVNEYIKDGMTPVCPAGGTYDYRVIGESPECSVHGDMDNPRENQYQSSP